MPARGQMRPVNTPEETAFARKVALELVGADRVTLQGPPLSGSEGLRLHALFMALVGSVTALLLLTRVHDRQLARADPSGWPAGD